MGEKIRRRLTTDGGSWESFTGGKWDRIGRSGPMGIVVVNHPRVFPRGWTVVRGGRSIGRFPTLREAQAFVDDMLAAERAALGRRVSADAALKD